MVSHSGHLIHNPSGTRLDAVSSYTALRAVAIQRDRFVLNGRPYYMRLVLDQGYWPDTGLTAPDDEALRRDVELAKAMGLNGVRKHQKLEDPRFLYWADKLGLMVWGEIANAYEYNAQAVDRLAREWLSAVKRDRSHPCIVTWVPINESWGVTDIALRKDQKSDRRHLPCQSLFAKRAGPEVRGRAAIRSQVASSIGIPPARRAARVRHSGSPGTRTSATPSTGGIARVRRSISSAEAL